MQEIVLTIRIKGNQFRVDGPVNDKMLCYGMLELAKDRIREYRPEAPGIQIPSPELAKVLNGVKN